MAKLLLAEDNREYREEYATELEKQGFEVVAVDDGLGIIEQVALQRFDVIISDTDMPTERERIDGDEACGRLLKEGKLKGVYIVAMSDSADYKHKYWPDIAHEFIEKDKVDASGLAERVKSYYEFWIDPENVRFKDRRVLKIDWK